MVANAAGADLQTVIGRVVDRGRQRVSKRPPPIYITGPGGAGSHWLASMAAKLLPAIDVGDVAIPPFLAENVEALTPSEQGFLIDCIHLAHAPAVRNDDLASRRVISSAPSIVSRRHKTWDPECFVIRLIRDPRDQVLGLTFRKGGYREYVARESSDEEYLLSRAVAIANNFEHWEACRWRPDFVLSYEQLRETTADTLTELLAALDARIDPGRIMEVVHMHDASEMRSGEIPRRGNITLKTNHGWRLEATQRQKALLHSELVEVVDAAGYPMGDCVGRQIDLGGSTVERRLNFAIDKPIGSIFVRGINSSDRGAIWRRLGEAIGDIHIPRDTEVKLRVYRRAPVADLTSFCALHNGDLDSLC